MKDRFEKFISENRENFDFRDPDPSIWEKVHKDIRRTRKINWLLVSKRAAMVILIFGASFIFHELMDRSENNPFMSMKGKKNSKENVIPGLNEAEAYYTGLVNQKMNELKPVIANCPSLQEEVDYDMSELDRVYTELKSDLNDNMANQEVIEAIIENYRLKISILEDLLKELEPLQEGCISKSNEYAL
jgi:hypothetical protein